MTALRLFNDLNYGVYKFNFPKSVQCFKDYEKAFAFFPDEGKIEIFLDEITLEELYAINKQCEELGMIYPPQDAPKEDNKNDLKPVEKTSTETTTPKAPLKKQVEEETLSNSPEALKKYLTQIVAMYNHICVNYPKEELIKALVSCMLDK